MMSLSPIDIYKELLPKTNCGDCGLPSCFAFATLVVTDKLPLKNCPHLEPGILDTYQEKLDDQHASGKWVKKDIQQDALEWARERSASVRIEDLPDRIGGELKNDTDALYVELPYFSDSIFIREEGISKRDGSELNRWEQVFIYNHIAQGGKAMPTGRWMGIVEFPNTVSKIKSMREHVEVPLQKRFSGHTDALLEAAKTFGGIDVTEEINSADVALLFRPVPRVPVMLLFWDGDREEGFEASVKLLFDVTITEHLDIESIMFLSERLKQLLCGDAD
jgi:hypothetical protein